MKKHHDNVNPYATGSSAWVLYHEYYELEACDRVVRIPCRNGTGEEDAVFCGGHLLSRGGVQVDVDSTTHINYRRVRNGAIHDNRNANPRSGRE